jgi:glucosyl-3-phosphoglycerate synthase
MSDFFQNGEIVAFHKLGEGHLEQLESELRESSKRRPVALILPALFSDLKSPAMAGIIHHLKDVDYLKQIIVVLARAEKEDFEEGKKILSPIKNKPKIIWIDSENIQNILTHLRQSGVEPGEDGKGRSAWLSYGYVLACGESDVIALHDCDIVTYDRELLARLCYPVANPNIDFEFCKGYYSRFTDRLHGRVTRLFVTPLIRTMKKILGHNDFLEYLDSFRYPLAGEFSMNADLARRIRIPGDWGLEVGVLAEVHRNCAIRRVCQVDITDAYEHKHQILSTDDPKGGLMKMTIDIAKSIFRTLASMGVVFSNEFFTTLRTTYLRTAQDFIARYDADSAINGLVYDRHLESKTAEAFVQSIVIAGQQFLESPIEFNFIPNWNRVIDAEPKIFSMLIDAVEKDNK